MIWRILNRLGIRHAPYNAGPLIFGGPVCGRCGRHYSLDEWTH